MSDFYISRKLYQDDQQVHDSELLGKSGVFVVLAEPGAGKTDLLNYLSRGYGVPRESASLFIYSPPSARSVLIIDSLDELARIDEAKINEIIFRTRATDAKTVILASRSYIWDEARNKAVHDCFGEKPTILRLQPFDTEEQRQLFTHYLPHENFEAFRVEAERFELTPILGNPQFLQLFADAYVGGGRCFTSKRQIYADALRRLASESTQTAAIRGRPKTEKIVEAAGEIFAKLLLSGATGISTQEDIGDSAYPYLPSISSDDDILTFTLNTRLFKPTQDANKHDPIHRIIAEYCAASYLIKRIEDPANTLSIRRCFSIIAPNDAVRSELRGLLGWMASLGGRFIQEAVIDLDTYAVFANGDPSQLLTTSKQLLLQGLKALVGVDPYFRRMDSWRRFSAAGFFSHDIVEHVRVLLAPEYAESHLRGLLLELLYKTEAAASLQQELRVILHDSTSEVGERRQAQENLDEIKGNDTIADFDILVTQPASHSLEIAAGMVLKRGVHHFGMIRLINLVEALAQLYPTEKPHDRSIGSRYFIRQFIKTLPINETVHLLNEITDRIICTCGKQEAYRCTCRIGRSKIAGILLDRYFEITIGPHDPQQIMRWTKPLIFRRELSPESSEAVQALRTNHGLRRAIHILSFKGVASDKEITDVRVQLSMSSSHSGLTIYSSDTRTIVDYAYSTGNNMLWEHFIARHNLYSSHKGPDELRAHMRSQARQSAELLRMWARSERSHREQMRKDFIRFGRSSKRYQQEEQKRKQANLLHLQQNRQQIESGQHWGWLIEFAAHYLHKDDEIESLVDDPKIIETALLNCFDFVTPHIPTLEVLTEEQGTSVCMVLEAACLATFRRNKTLKGISINTLEAIKADGIGGSGYQEDEAERFEAEIDRLLFFSDEDRIAFARRYIEPQFARSEDSTTRVHIIENSPSYNSVKGSLSLDWLTRYPEMPSASRHTLFGIATSHADRDALISLIETRCNEPIDAASEVERKRRKFWLLCHFFFITPTSDALWAELSADPKSIFSIERYAGRSSRRDGENWPQLNAQQIYSILDAFVSVWPKVHLPNSWGTGDPEEETAYRFIKDIVYLMGQDAPSVSIPVFDRLLSDGRFLDLHNGIKSQKAIALRQLALAGFRPPTSNEISRLLDESKIASVEDMRAVLIEQLEGLQIYLKGAATAPVDVFYNGDKRVDENTSRNRIIEMLERQLNALHLGVVIEHHMSDNTRCDFTASTSIGGFPAVLVAEVKGQWHPDLYNAASLQLADRYTIYPGAAEQGLYLVLWFGNDEVVAGKKAPLIRSATELRQSIIDSMPENLLGRIDVYVLDVSRPAKTKAGTQPRKRKSRANRAKDA